jgi:hypothetical protein
VNSTDAKRVLIACRPGTEDVREPAVLAALELVQRDPELQRWWEQQQVFQDSVRESFRAVPVPRSLRNRVLARAKIVEVPWWRGPVAWGAAAAIAILLTFFATRAPAPGEDSFQTFRSRMVGNVLRQYSMTVVTNDMAPIRQHLATNNAPADYVLPQNLARLPVMGAGLLSWKDRRVSMVCLDAGAQGTVFLFVVDGSSVKNPPRQREYVPVNSLNTASWTEGGKAYVLAGSGGQDWLQSFF